MLPFGEMFLPNLADLIVLHRLFPYVIDKAGFL